MTRYTIKSFVAAAACATISTFAPLGSAQADGEPLSECRKTTDTGEDLRCFDCYRQVGSGENQRWVNVCSNRDDQ
jgi:hypothetical protein